MTAGRSDGARFLNADVPPPLNGFDQHQGSKSVTVKDLPLETLLIHPLSGKIKLLGIIQADAKDDILSRIRTQVSGIVFRLDDRRYVANVGEPIVDEAGNPVESLRDWKVTHGSARLAVFRNGDAEAVVRAEAK
jgi:hypothetical protein